jgi:hypothetical protein
MISCSPIGASFIRNFPFSSVTVPMEVLMIPTDAQATGPFSSETMPVIAEFCANDNSDIKRYKSKVMVWKNNFRIQQK